MARPSKLTQKQWDAIEQRLLVGEKASDLAKEHGIDRAALTRRFAQQNKVVKNVANQLLAAEGALRALPVAQQINAINLADQLRSISGHLAGAANYGAATAHRLSGIANAKVAEISDCEPFSDKGAATLKEIAVLTSLANESSRIGVNLISANKDLVAGMNAAAESANAMQGAATTMRPQLTREEWMAAHGVGTTTGPAK